ncbi:hypothetical protein [Actinacidiphila acididurans]|uniref:Uncharacterized protein n=1 Tax=Actinacidiphila acididurans TaxID=2784346 RepID=A0ABS2U334_9ACTN|nr:hypothetical protein [Actinacidiphila acididurans]MBM9509994.1 hypothetical protein [Actinacidiphila acididurans]
MGQRHPLATEGAWVELRDVDELRAGDQMDIQGAMDDEESVNRRAVQMYNGLITALVMSWSLPLPIPSQAPDTPQSAGSLRLMGIKDYAALKRLVAPAVEVVFPADPEPKTAEALETAKADPGSPTGDADAS